MSSMALRSTATRSSSSYNGYVAARPAILGLSKILFVGLAQISTAAALPLNAAFAVAKKNSDDPKDPEDPSLWIYLSIAIVLVLLGGAFAGLTIALMGQDGVYLQVIATSGEGKEQKHAKRVHTLLGKGKHWVLVTLLLSNVIVNETLPIVLDRSLGGGWPAVLSSTVLIVIFGEVIPQSICVRYGMQIGAAMSPFVLVLMYLLAPIAWPTAKLLDKLLGEDHGTVYKKSGLKTLVTLHKTLGTSPSDRLNQDEVTIISAVLDLKDKPVGNIMTPMEDVFTMSADTVLDEKTMDVILSAGYSRIPIFEPGNEKNFVGMLLVKILITYDPEDCKRVSEFALATLPETRPETSCLDIVNFFQEGKSHMVLVSDFPGENYGAIGVVTLEDVIEELIGEEIIDESDVYIDVHKAIRRMAPAPKARAQKGQIIAEPETLLADSETQLIDIADDSPPADGQKLKQERSDGSPHFASSPKTTFLMRRSSGLQDGTCTTVPVRGNVNDMREHLKHLGPSNLASRPKQTRYQSVKIKQGLGNSDGSNNTAQPSIIEEPYRDFPAARGGEGEGLLQSAGREASDGVQAIQQGYGSFDRRSSQASNASNKSSKSNKDEFKSPLAQVEGASEEAPKSSGSNKNFGNMSYAQAAQPSSKDNSRPTSRREESNETQQSSDTLGSLPSREVSPTPRKNMSAKSGSITENIIDSNGVRKVVLETTSSSDDHAASEEGHNETERLLTGQSSNGGQMKGEEVKKKNKRKRKKKGGKS